MRSFGTGETSLGVRPARNGGSDAKVHLLMTISKAGAFSNRCIVYSNSYIVDAALGERLLEMICPQLTFLRDCTFLNTSGPAETTRSP